MFCQIFCGQERDTIFGGLTRGCQKLPFGPILGRFGPFCEKLMFAKIAIWSYFCTIQALGVSPMRFYSVFTEGEVVAGSRR